MTAEEFLEEFNKKEYNEDRVYYSQYIQKFAKEFAKLHVTAALKAANNTVIRDKYSIPNAYPLTNIK